MRVCLVRILCDSSAFRNEDPMRQMWLQDRESELLVVSWGEGSIGLCAQRKGYREATAGRGSYDCFGENSGNSHFYGLLLLKCHGVRFWGSVPWTMSAWLLHVSSQEFVSKLPKKSLWVSHLWISKASTSDNVPLRRLLSFPLHPVS
jgi:hypothetical protein